METCTDNDVVKSIHEEIEFFTNKIISLERLLVWQDELKKEGKIFFPMMRLLGSAIEDENEEKVDVKNIEHTKTEACPWCNQKNSSSRENPNKLRREGYILIHKSIAGKYDAHEIKCGECNQIFWSAIHKDNIENEGYYKSFRNAEEFQWEAIEVNE